ncbi:PREDICTED: uncharacterized protein LOC108535960 [Rhinopithecus bieti]|uniref:uncharacterized protein LOC108535960 n=1 Tax=Rhinopithecus bieti TaxID=61621 RepID=UPI00083C2D7A|nr:PREDICTED: uncharacterized protein LOC108535960 [Rhinopithecus bieti]
MPPMLLLSRGVTSRMTLNLEKDLHWTHWPRASVCQSSAQPQYTEDGALPDALVSCIELCELFCPADPLALTDIDGDPGGRIALDLLVLTQCPSAGCSAPDKLKLWPFLVPWYPAQSSVSSSAQDMDGDPPEKACGPWTPGFDFRMRPCLDTCPLPVPPNGEPGGRLALGPMDPGQWPSARCPPWCAEAWDLPVILVSYGAV